MYFISESSEMDFSKNIVLHFIQVICTATKKHYVSEMLSPYPFALIVEFLQIFEITKMFQ